MTILPENAKTNASIALLLPIDSDMEWHIKRSLVQLVRTGPGYMGSTNYTVVRSIRYTGDMAGAISECWLQWKEGK